VSSICCCYPFHRFHSYTSSRRAIKKQNNTMTITRSSLLRLFRRNPDRFLRHVPGVIHVGANTGQERDLYEKHGLRVIWIEPIPEVYSRLQHALLRYPKQRALQYLVTDRDDAEYAFHIANNDGASSSIYEFQLHKEVWPEVAYDRTVTMRSMTLTSLLKQESINPSDYPALIMDVQGSELLVLKGAIDILPAFGFIKTEVADFESYVGCCQIEDIEVFLKANAFNEFSRTKFAERSGGGNYYDIVYQRRSLGR
jgi:FkbM family methyltransferase